MASRVYVHVGPFKTGTTFIQQALDANRERLADQGVLVPVRGTRLHAQAVADTLGMPADEGVTRISWEHLAAEVREWDGPTAVVSTEFLSRARRKHVNRMVAALRPVEVHVVFMARDLSRVLPAMWQTAMRAGRAETWPEYLAAVRGDRDASGSGERFWQTHDPRLVLGRWGSAVPAGRIHVVTVPPSGSDPALLWQRFCGVVGMDPARCSLEVRRRNESLGTVEADLLRRVNAKVAQDMSRSAYNRWVKRYVAREVLERRPGQRRFALPEPEMSWLRPRAEEIVGFLADSGYDVVGDLDEVLPAPVPAGVAAPDDAPPDEVLDTAVEVIAGLLAKLQRSRRPGAFTGPAQVNREGGAAGAHGRRTGRRARSRTRR